MLLVIKSMHQLSTKIQIWAPRKQFHLLASKFIKLYSMHQMEEDDRISQLPDPLLLQILSLIDVTQAVQTTIFSKRWKNLCFSLPDLHFRLSRAAAHSGVNLSDRKSAQAFSDQFSHFVSHFLSHHTAAVRNFHLSFDCSQIHVDAEFMEKCIDHAVKNGVKSLHLDAVSHPEMRLPAAFFASESLLELELRQFGDGIVVPEEFSLPNLKTLYLKNSVFVNDDELFSFSELKEPFSRFPELEKLTLWRSTVYGLAIVGPKLRVLEIIQDEMMNELVREVTAPLLTSFRYEGDFPLECMKMNLPMLEEVYLDIYEKLRPANRRYENLPWNQDKSYLKRVRMFEQLGHAQTVAITLDTLKALEMDRDMILQSSTSPFPYMKCLKLRKGRGESQTVVKRVMEYLTEGSLCCDLTAVEIPDGVTVVEVEWDNLFDEDNQLQLLFGKLDQPPPWLHYQYM